MRRNKDSVRDLTAAMPAEEAMVRQLTEKEMEMVGGAGYDPVPNSGGTSYLPV